MASKAQRAVTGVPPERWAQLGRALQEWREDELGYKVRGRFADDRHINLRLVQDLEKNYRPGTYTKWALQDAARAYEVPYAPDPPEDEPRTLPDSMYGPGSILAFLRGDADALARAEITSPKEPAAISPLDLPPSPFDPARTAVNRPYALAIWKRFLDLPRRVTEPSGAQMFGDDPDDEKAWDGIGSRLSVGDRMWFIADLRRRAAGRTADPAANSHGALRRGNVAG